MIGGGDIGCELAQLFARLGSRLTLVTRSRLLPEAEPEVSGALTGYLRDEGITVRPGLRYREIPQTATGVVPSIDVDGRTEQIVARRVLVATGRKPNTDGMGLIEAGIAFDQRGAIIIDDQMRTSLAGVYAAGDVTNRAMPWVVFTDPQVSGAGLTEAAARAAGYDVQTSSITLNQVPRALAARDTRGLIKLVADARTDVLLGGQILAPESADAVQTLVLAIKHSMTVGALAETLFPHLTTVEGLKRAALGFKTDVARLSCCAG